MKGSKTAMTESTVVDDDLDTTNTEGAAQEDNRSFTAGGSDTMTEDSAVEGFRGPQVCKLIGISYRQLDYWARTGLLTPSVVQAAGSGTQRIYSYSDLLELKVLKRLLDSGVSLRSARKAVDCLRDGVGGELGSSTLVFAGGKSLLAHSNDEVVDLLRNGQGVFSMVALQGIVEELDADITTLSSRYESPVSSDESTYSGQSDPDKKSNKASDGSSLSHAI